jgi:thioredoxin-like negative regulator of GroEL
VRAAQDFNYKVALASGIRSLEGGRLRRAEEQFRYLIAKFPEAEGGYRGLAKVLVQLDDSRGALATLVQGGAALAGGGERQGAITLLRQAIALDPQDLSAHRRLAAALSLSGAAAEAVAECVRFSQGEIAAQREDRARQEIAYALERFGPAPPLVALARTLGVRPPGEAQPLEDTDGPAALQHAAAARSAAETSRAEELAAELRAGRDEGAASAALDAARAHLAAGRPHAASDLLLQVIASGSDGHEAQRLLVDVTCALGTPEAARAKCVLLAEALRLAGREAAAADVARLAESL